VLTASNVSQPVYAGMVANGGTASSFRSVSMSAFETRRAGTTMEKVRRHDCGSKRAEGKDWRCEGNAVEMRWID
jgi:hypothetical protein